MSAGTVTTGELPGSTVIVNVAFVAATPTREVALHVTVVVPIANVEPDGGLQVTGSFGAPAGSVALAV
jgi:hypothetical protein